MASGGPVRQRYSLATGGGLQQAASGPSGSRPKYAKGGRVIKPKSNVRGKDDKYTSITHSKSQIAKGFKVHGP